MNRRNWREIQLFTLQAIVIIIFMGALFGVVSGLYGGLRYFKPNYQQQAK